MKAEKLRELKEFAIRIRMAEIDALSRFGNGHIGGVLSVTDVLALLYGDVMKIDPKDPAMEERDLLVFSKGHCGLALYATLALKQYFPYEMLYTLNRPHTKLPSHCDRTKTPGVDMTAGSLGQGSSCAVGMALGCRLKGLSSRVFTILGDGEINEGQVWEAAMFAAARQLDNLYFFVDWNKKQLDGWCKNVLDTGDLAEKFASFGFDSHCVDGHDIAAIAALLEETAKVKKPHAIILDTVKGKGVRELEERLNNHSISFEPGEREAFLQELEEQLLQLKKEAENDD